MDKVVAFLVGTLKGVLWGTTLTACIIWLFWFITPAEAAEDIKIGTEYNFTHYPNVELDHATELRLRALIRLHKEARGCRACRIETWKATTQEERNKTRSERIEQLYEEYFHDEE